MFPCYIPENDVNVAGEKELRRTLEKNGRPANKKKKVDLARSTMAQAEKNGREEDLNRPRPRGHRMKRGDRKVKRQVVHEKGRKACGEPRTNLRRKR